MKALDQVKYRCRPDAWEVLMNSYGEVFNKQPVPFHWDNGGVFRTEEKGADELSSDSDDEEDVLQFLPPRGIFQHHQQLDAHHKRPEPGELHIGNMVVTLPRAVPPSEWGYAPDTSYTGFRLGANRTS